MPLRYIKGGNSTSISTTSAKPFQQYGYPDGASSAREASISRQNTMNARQQSMINKHGGVRRRKTKRNKYNKTKRYGGNSSGRTVTVPQFSTNSVGPVDANSSSINNNTTGMQALADSVGDCYATNSCTTQINSSQTGGNQQWHSVWEPGSFGAPGMTGGPKYNGPKMNGAGRKYNRKSKRKTNRKSKRSKTKHM